mgnify:CR=1 FL=1
MKVAVTVVSTAVAALVEGMAAVVALADMAAEKVAAEKTAEPEVTGVAYAHLTLPTVDSVSASVVEGAVVNKHGA